jgi:thiol:disulfide interchange protein DsbD
MSAKKRMTVLIAFALAACLAAPAGAAEAPSAASPVRVELLADVASVAPGAAFHLAVRFKLAPEWHIYWLNPSESGVGQPTRIDLAGPLVKIGAWHYPPPLIFGAGTPDFAYVYEKETTLWAEAAAAPDAPAGGEVIVSGKVAWLACLSKCIVGGQEISLKLPVAATAAPGPNAAAVNAARAATPVPASAVPGLSIGAQYDAAALAPGQEFQTLFTIKAPAGAQLAPTRDRGRPIFAEFKNEHLDIAKITAADADPTPHQGLLVKVVATVRPDFGAGEKFGGVFQFDLIEQGKRRAVAVEADWPLPAPAPGAAVKAPLDRPLGAVTASTGGAAAPARAARGLLWMLLSAFVGGMILNIMPCVLPVVSLKIFSLISQAHLEKSALRRHGLGYAAGILSSFLALATVVAALKRSGEAVGWGFQMQSPAFVGLLAAVAFVFGLSALDVFLLLAPTSAAMHRAAAKEGVRGSLFNGVFATVLATPCSAPILGPAIGFAFAQPIGVTFAVFFTVGLGLAFPFLLLAYFPGWTRWMPKPGAWMDTAKSVMGFLLIGASVWLLGVLSEQVGAAGLRQMLSYFALLGFAAWLYGRFGNVTRSAHVRLAATLAAAAIAVAGGAHFLRFALAEAAPAAGGATVEDGGIAWRPFSPEIVKQLTAEGKTVFLDFTATWCMTCKANESAAIKTEPVRQAIARLGVVAVRGDWTKRDPQIGGFLATYGRNSVPSYAVIGPGVGGQPYWLPELITATMVVDALEKAAKPS